VRAIRRGWGKLRLDWRVGLLRLPFFTQRTAVLLVGVLVATLALLGGVVTLIGSPWSAGPTHLVPGGQAGEQPSPRPATGDRASGPAGAAAGPGAPSAAPVPAAAAGARVGGGREAAGSQEPGGTATGAQGSGGAAGAGAGGPPAAPPTTSPPTTTPNGPLPPLDELLGPVVSTLLP